MRARWHVMTLSLAAALFLLGAGDPEKEKEAAPPPTGGGPVPPFGEAPKAAAPKPDTRTWNARAGELAFTAVMKPGIPDPGQVVEVIITAASIPKTPHPKYGSRVPMEAASIIVELTSPAGEVVGRFVAHPMPLTAGKYGLHLTPANDGLYTMGIRGSTAQGQAISADIKLPVKVWPLPAELQGTGEPSEGGARRPIKG